MIHLAHAAPKLARVVRPIGLPLAATRAPLGPAVRLADKHVLAVKALQPWAVRVHVDRRPALGLDVGLLVTASLLSASLSSSSRGRWRRWVLFVGGVVVLAVDKRHQARVADDGDKGAEVRCNHDGKDDKVRDNHAGAEADAALLLDVVLHCKRHGQRTTHKTRQANYAPHMCPT